MKSLQEQLDAYSAYHKDPWNKLTHFVGVPLVTFSLFVFLGWFRVVQAPDFPLLSGAALFYLVVFVYYLCLDRFVALLQAPFTVALLWLADWVSLRPFAESLMVFLATFVGGWVIQLLGHALEGRRPALADNILQVFNAPLFLTVEVLLLLGIRKGTYSLPSQSPTPLDRIEVKELSMDDQLVETWTIHNRINLYLLNAVPEETLAAVLSPKSRSVWDLFAHVHNVRLMWLQSAAPELLAGLEKLETKTIGTKEQLVAALEASGQAIEGLFRKALAAGGKVKGFKPHAVAFLGYLISHESHHRGQIGWTLKYAGHPLDKKTAFGLWEWGVR